MQMVSWASWQKLWDHRQWSPSASLLASQQILLLGMAKGTGKNSNSVILTFYDLTMSFLAFGDL